MVKVGINALYLIPGGVGGTETYLRKLLPALAEADSENEYVIFSNVENAGSFALPPERFREVVCPVHAKNRPMRIAFEQTWLPILVSRNRIDVLHSPGYTAPLLIGCASVVTIHDLNYHYFPEDWSTAALWANRILLPRVARRSTRILTVSRASAQAIAEIMRVPEDKLDIVYSGIDGNLPSSGQDDERAIRAKYDLQGSFILSVTASHPHKNLDGLVRSYALATRDWADAPPLVIVGIKGRHQHQIEKMITQQGCNSRIVLTGWIESTELAALYRAAMLFVFVSKYEGFGFPVLEAMTAGVPVVSSNATSLPELVGNAGILVDPSDELEIATAMVKAIHDEGLRRNLIARGHSQAAQFTWKTTAEGTLASYRRATAQ